MPKKLEGKNVAILAADGFEQSELTEPRQALLDAGAATAIISLESGTVKGWNEDHFDEEFDVDDTVEHASAEEFDALLLPGGVINPDRLRQSPEAVRFVREFFVAGKPVAAICHGPIMLIEADVVRDRTLTSYPSIRRDLMNAGATWIDAPVVVDQGLVTSRRPDDLAQFNEKLVEEVAEGIHAGQHA
jgi:protease I